MRTLEVDQYAPATAVILLKLSISSPPHRPQGYAPCGYGIADGTEQPRKIPKDARHGPVGGEGIVLLTNPCDSGQALIMGRIALLREQAAILRTLARSFDIPSIRDQLLALANHLELAKRIEEKPQGADLKPGVPPD